MPCGAVCFPKPVLPIFRKSFLPTVTTKATPPICKGKMRDASIRIQNFVRRDNPELWAAAEAKMQETVKIRLFGLLPLLTIKRSLNRELWLLFGFVRLFDVGRKRVRKSPG